MAMAVSSGVQEQDISWNTNKIINQSNISIDAGQATSIGSGSIAINCNYLRIKAIVSVDDTTLSTDDFKTVSVVVTIHYTDNDNNIKILQHSFFPDFQHETNKIDTEIINAPTNIFNMGVEIYNNETTETITVDNISIEYNNMPIDEETVNDIVDDYINNNMMHLQILNDLPDISTLYNGSIFILETLPGNN